MTIPIAAILDRKGRDVVTIRPDASVTEAARTLSEHGIGALVVSADGRRVEGILSERDIVRRIASDGPRILDHPVREVMTASVTTCAPDATADQLMSTMTEGRMRHLPVVDADGQLVGLVSIGDVVKSHIDELEVQAESLQEYVTGSGY
jgi:CBS domain-containing protein